MRWFHFFPHKSDLSKASSSVSPSDAETVCSVSSSKRTTNVTLLRTATQFVVALAWEKIILRADNRVALITIPLNNPATFLYT